MLLINLLFFNGSSAHVFIIKAVIRNLSASTYQSISRLLLRSFLSDHHSGILAVFLVDQLSNSFVTRKKIRTGRRPPHDYTLVTDLEDDEHAQQIWTLVIGVSTFLSISPFSRVQNLASFLQFLRIFSGFPLPFLDFQFQAISKKFLDFTNLSQSIFQLNQRFFS